MTMFSRVLGFARDAIVARIFGAGMATDAFFVAFKLPNLLRRIFAEGAFSQAFVPILAEYKSKQGEDATRVFVSYVSGLLTLALAIVTVIGMLAAPTSFARSSSVQRMRRGDEAVLDGHLGQLIRADMVLDDLPADKPLERLVGRQSDLRRVGAIDDQGDRRGLRAA